MRTAFGDSYYCFALLSSSDEGHALSVEFTQTFHGLLLTSEWALNEVADGLAGTKEGREPFLQLRAQLATQPANVGP